MWAVGVCFIFYIFSGTNLIRAKSIDSSPIVWYADE